MEKRTIYWTLGNFGVAYMFIQIGYFGLEALQSTLNFRDGLGTTCVGVLNGCAVISNLFIGPIIVQKLSPKWTLFASFLAQTVYIIANYFPSWNTLVLASALVGFTLPFSGIAYGVYLTSLACRHSSLVAKQRQLRHCDDVIDKEITSGEAGIVDSLIAADARNNQDDVDIKSIQYGDNIKANKYQKEENGETNNEDNNSSGRNITHDLFNNNINENFKGNENKNHISTVVVDKNASISEISQENISKTLMIEEHNDMEIEKALEELETGDFDDPATQKIFVKLNSIMITFLTTGGLLGNITSSLVLGRGKKEIPVTNTTSILVENNQDEFPTPFLNDEDLYSPNSGDYYPAKFLNNFTTFSPAVNEGVCGINHCPSRSDSLVQTVIEEPERYLVYIMLSIYLVCNIIGLILTTVLRPMYNERAKALEQTAKASKDKNGIEEKGSKCCTVFWVVLRKATETLRLMKDVNLLLTIMPMFWIGVVTSMTVGAFNQSFIGCSLGISYVGYAMTSLRLLFVITSHVAARLLHCLHRRYLIISSMVLQILIVTSWFLAPSYEGAGLLITCCAVIGCSLGLFKTVFYGLYPLLFPDNLESALAHNSIWDCMGLSAAFIASDHLCFRYKAFITAVLTILAMISYGVLEFRIRPLKPLTIPEGENSSESSNSKEDYD